MSEDLADHGFLDNRLLLREPRRGHRSGTDAVLLAAAAHAWDGGHVIDAGAGAGAAALALLAQAEAVTATLLEADPAMAALASHNVETNGFAARGRIVTADLFDVAGCRELRESADIVMSNPPFYRAGEVRASHHAQRRTSHVLADRSHAEWFARLFALARPRGRVAVIHRVEALQEFLVVARRRGAVALRFVHGTAGGEAKRVLMSATLGSRAPLAVLPPLVLHGPEGRFTEEAEAIHRGRWVEDAAEILKQKGRLEAGPS